MGKIVVDFVLVGRIDWYLVKPVLKIVTSAAPCAVSSSPGRLLPVGCDAVSGVETKR